jgi:subtilase family serine protease
MPRIDLRSRLLAGIAAATTAAALTLAGGTTASAAQADTFPDAKPTWARTANDRGAAAADDTVEGELAFALRDPDGAVQLATAVSTPGDPLYGEHMTPKQWIARFAPRKADYRATLAYLRDNDLTITGTPRSRLFITFRGHVEQLEDLFATDLRRFRHDGRIVVAPATAPSLPKRVAAAVSGVYLGTSRTAVQPRTSTPAAEGDPVSLDGYRCSRFWQQHSLTLPEAYGTTEFPTANCGYTGAQLRKAFGLKASMTGAGQTVAIVDAYASPTILSDFRTFAKRNGGTPLTSATYRQIVPKRFYDTDLCGGIGGWQGEQVLDVTAVHGIAPKATIQYVGAFNCGTGIDVAVSRILDDGLATIVSNSYGYTGELPLDVVQVNENQFLQAAAQGIGMYFSSGDLGDNADVLGAPSPDYPASSPWVTAVGGTSTAIARNGSIAVETGWGNRYAAIVEGADGAPVYDETPPGTFASGAGGGISAVFGRPAYQDGLLDTDGRAVPDVASIGDPRTGLLTGYREYRDGSGRSARYDEVILGGTSLAAPLVAAQVALAQQRTHRTYGFLNPLLYAGAQSGRPVVRDVLPATLTVAYNDQTTGETSLVTGNQDTSLTVDPGWDPVTGLGALRVQGLVGAKR